MPIESIEMPKAPKGWTPSKDQAQRIAQDERLRRLSKDEQYAFFNQPKKPATRRAAPAKPAANATGWVDQIVRGLKGET